MSKALEELKKAMWEERVEPCRGLPEELFIFSTTLAPTVNIDLFITNEKRQLLLTWRDDIYCGRGWHIPGGCVRLKERLAERITKTAEKELGVPIVYDPVPLAVREAIEQDYRPNLLNQLERCHSIAFLYQCSLQSGCEIPEQKSGTKLRWFDRLPENLLKLHLNLYGDIIENYFNGGTRK